MALDHLGVVASRLRSISLKFSSRSLAERSEERVLKSMEEVSHPFSFGRNLLIASKIYSNLNVSELDMRVSAHQELFSFLCKHSAEDQSYDVNTTLPPYSLTNLF